MSEHVEQPVETEKIFFILQKSFVDLFLGP